jgi:pyruvate dehydrogenase E2 component (dihydrolipoamide acetyltransferase)
MAQEIVMPKLGLTMTKGLLSKWLKTEGEVVKAGDPVAEIETEKITNTIECPADGILLKMLANEGETYPVAHVLGYVGAEGEKISGIPDAPAPGIVSGERSRATPVAKKLAEQLGVDISLVSGTGPDGRITKEDVLNFAGKAPAPPALVKSDFTEPAGEIPPALKTRPYSGIRRAIGENMLKSWTTVPSVTHHVMADASDMLQFRDLVNSGVSEKKDRVGIMDLLLKITALTLEETPEMNVFLRDDREIVQNAAVNIGVAVALEDGLIVPVVKNVNSKSLLAVSRETSKLVERARSGNLTPDDLAGGGFTISNLGGFGSVDFFTPIVYLPQAAILGIGRIVDTVVPASESFAVKPMIGLSLSYDHRLIDGATAAEFMRKFICHLANPARSVSQ